MIRDDRLAVYAANRELDRRRNQAAQEAEDADARRMLWLVVLAAITLLGFVVVKRFGG
jgi:hypothetical protein